MHTHRFTSAPPYVPHFVSSTGLYIKYFYLLSYSHILLRPTLKNLTNRPCCTALSEQNGATLPRGTMPAYLHVYVYTGTLSRHRAAALCLQLLQFQECIFKCWKREVNSFTNATAELTCTNCKVSCLLQDFSWTPKCAAPYCRGAAFHWQAKLSLCLRSKRAL